MEGSAIHRPDTLIWLRCAPKIFNSVADALEWIAKARGAELTYHYLDDFLVIGAPSSNACSNSLEILLQACSDLGVPVASHKCTGPTTCLIFLGIVIDTVKMEIRLPEEKMKQLKRLLAFWKVKKGCTQRELESLIGHLQHAAKVVRSGRRLIRGMLSLLQGKRKPHHYITQGYQGMGPAMFNTRSDN